ncbi:ABC transporter permease [Haladaptatus sp. CMAA 1911]|uniref:ABC transporter permease n=1 Tax=Haladaptatus sp. CMAA 1911 TaxID=3368987 RepID=UPI0037544DF4
MIQTQQGAVSQSQLNTLVQAYINIQPDKPIYLQYVDYLSALLHGNLGTSIWYGEPVVDIILSAVPWTIFIMTISLLLTFGLGTALGAIMAYAEGSRFDVSASTLSTFLNSIPFYVVAIVLVYILGYIYGIFPTGGRYDYDTVTPGLSIAFLGSVLYHAVLPIITMVITGFGGWALSMRGNSIQVLGEDYLRVARLRGLPSQQIALRYVGRNAVLPMYTSLMISIGFLLGGSVILEQIFQYQGMGFYLFRAIKTSDYPLMMGGFLIITIAVVVAIFIADLTYGFIDPRAGRGDSNESF